MCPTKLPKISNMDGITSSNSRVGGLFNGLKDLLTSGRHSDLTITCSGESFKVHKVLLDAASPVFSKMLSGPFREAVEVHGIIELHDDLDALQALIAHIYHDNYDDSFAGEGSTMCFAVRVYAIADKYEVTKLQSLAADKLKSLSKKPKDHPEFIAALNLINGCTNPNDSTLDDIVLPQIKKNLTTLLQLDDFKEHVLDNRALNLELLSMLGEKESPKPTIEPPRAQPNQPSTYSLANSTSVNTYPTPVLQIMRYGEHTRQTTYDAFGGVSSQVTWSNRN